MNRGRIAGLVLALVCGEAFAASLTDGWDNVNSDRAWPQTTNVVWRAPFAEGAAAFDVSRRGGAEGTVEFRADGIRIAKTNSRGAIVVTAKRPFRHVNKSSPRTFANVREADGDPMRSLGFLRIWSGKENLTISGNGAYGPSPLNHCMIGTEPQGKVRKLALPPSESAAGPDFTPAIVVAGAPSTGLWTDWGAEDVGDADQAWKKYKADLWRTGVRNHSGEVSPEDEVMRAIAADTDHTAKVVRRDGFARLTIDGRDAPPVFYKGYGGPYAYCGRRMEEKADLRLQIAGITFGGRVTNDPGIRPHWTRGGFDLTGAVERVRHYLRAAPNSLFLLGISVNPYPEFADDHPSERWIGPDGQPVRGRGCIVAWDQKAAAKDPQAWTLTSQFSPLWREQAKAHIAALIAELKRTGLAKRIVGVHLSGSHDGQFGMPLYDYSPHAKAAYRRFLAARGKPPADPPDFARYGTAETGVDFFRDPKDRDLVDFQEFIHHASVDLQEDLARHAKACFGKDVIAVKYCLSVFAGLRAGEFDFTRFLDSDAIDVFAAQSCYKRRPAAIPIPEKRVTASLHEHGKLFVSELDFEAYHRGPTFCRDEFAAMSWGYLLDYPMWEAANRKAVGQMLAQRQGFWYYDMGGDYFDDDRMLADIRGVMATTRGLVRGTPSAWRPSAAVVVDEKGMMFRNFSRASHGTIVDARDSVAEQLALLEMSAAPFDTWLMDDFLRQPELAERYRTVVLLGSYELDAARRDLIGRLCRGGRTVVLGSGAGVVGGAAEIGLPLDVVPRQQTPGHEIVPAPGYADEDVKGFFETEALRVALGAAPGTPKHAVRRPHRVSVAAADGVDVIGRYAADGATAIAAKRIGEGRIVAVCDQMGLTPSLFNRLVRESGGYVCGLPGHVQVNMNGDFISVHCLRSGHYDLELPFVAKVTNLRSGQVERTDGKVLPLELTAGRTCWFALTPVTAGAAAGEAQFISPAEKREGHTVASFYKTLTNAKEIRSATLSATALGVFEVEVNGTKVGNDFLKPGFTECGKCRHVFMYDVTHLMKTAEGDENCFIAQVAPTWWCDQINRAKTPTPWQLGKEVAFRGELAVEYADGSRETFGTGTDWLAAYSASTQTAGLYEGEVVDRRESIDFLKPAKVNDEFHGELRPAAAKIRLREDLALAPKDIYVTCGAEGATSNAYGRARVVRRYRDGDEILLDKGELLVLDFGQNCAAVPMLQFSGRAGTTLELRHAEMLNEANGEKSRGNDGPAGTPYLASLRSAYAGIRYTLAGGGDTYRPSFTFFGYRYIGVTTTAPVKFVRFRSIPVSSVTKEMERGTIVTGNARVNRLIENVRWGMRSNFISIPTDCPQRDERLGWTADTQVFMNTAAYFADTWDFLRKYLADMRDGQATNGLYRCFAPNVRHIFPPWASCGWTDAGVIIPYRLWKWYGKREVIDENWEAMDRYMGFLRSHKTPYQINHADWLAYEHRNPKKGGLMQDPQYVKVLNAYFPIWMARLMKEMAAATGRTADAARYAEEEERYHRAFAETYVGEDGCMKDYWKGQCSDLYMLKLGLCGNDAAVEATKRHLVADIRAHGNQLQTGFLGTAILMPTLTFEANAPEVAYDLLLQDKDPSWLYSVDQGATTVWERWNSYTKAKGFGPTSMNSFNHYAYGCVVEWLFSAAAGIRPDPTCPGWRHFILRPYPDRRLGSVDATYDSPAGRIRSAWSYASDGGLEWRFSIPAGTTATVTLPSGETREFGPGEYCEKAPATAGGGNPHGLTTEYRVDPVGIDSVCPRLSWKLPDGSARQTAYELELDGACQGKVESAETLNRPWTGGGLATGSRHVWRVRVWDGNGVPTGWSEPARFTMGVMRPDDWRAKWIGPNAATRPDVDFLDAQWMTSTAGVLRLSFDLDRVPENKEIVFLSRNRYNLSVNGLQSRGSYAGHTWSPRFAKFHNLADDGLKVGRNVVEFRSRRQGEPLAVIAVLRERGASVSAVRFADATALGGVRDMDWCRDPVLRDEIASPAFERRFRVTKDVRSATLFVTGLGFYEASLNGTRIGDKVLDPSPTDYRKRVLYSTYLLDGALTKGENVLRVLVGHGFYDVRLKSVWDNDMAGWRDFPRMIAQLEIDYADGTHETVVSDESWRQVKSPVGWDDIREGEVVGGRHVREPAFPADGFPVAVVPAPNGALAAENHPPSRIVRENAPRRMEPVAGRPGAWMVEFPDNIAGWVRLRVRGLSSGDVVTIRYDERADADLKPAVPDAYYRQRGIDTLGLQGRVKGPVPRAIDYHFKSTQSANVCATNRAFQTDRFVSAGAAEETYEPRFTYNGFQYVLLEGLKTPPAADVVQCVVSTDFPETGTFASSDPILDRLVAAAARTYRANFTVGIPTDCPHREKNGWTGDASVASDFAQFRFENTSAYEKWLTDVCDAQNGEGAIPGIVPSPDWGFAWGNGPAWDSALYVVARNLYRYRDDRRVVGLTYPTMVRHLAWTETKADANGLVRYGLDDWIPPSRKYVPAAEFTSSCFFKQANEIAAEFAAVLGKADESARYAARAAAIRRAIRTKYMKPDGTFANGGQTAQSAALMFGLVDPSEREKVAARLVESVHRRNDHLETGVIGCKTLFRALSETGHTDLALKVVLQKDAPSPAAWMHQGGDNFWEDWGEGASRNHIMFGDIACWAYEYLAGIRQAPGSRGFRQVLFAPPAGLALDHVAASVDTPYGVYSVSWRKNPDGGLDCRFHVPAGGSAVVRLPGREDVALAPGRHDLVSGR